MDGWSICEFLLHAIYVTSHLAMRDHQREFCAMTINECVSCCLGVLHFITAWIFQMTCGNNIIVLFVLS